VIHRKCVPCKIHSHIYLLTTCCDQLLKHILTHLDSDIVIQHQEKWNRFNFTSHTTGISLYLRLCICLQCIRTCEVILAI